MLNKNIIKKIHLYLERFGSQFQFDATKSLNITHHIYDQDNRCVGIQESKLEALGIRGIQLQWFQWYLTDRKQKFTIDNLSSDAAEVNFEVP